MTATATHPPAEDLRTGEGRWPRRVFVAGLVVAAPLLLWFGRDHWFFLDEWLVLQRDGLTDPGYLDAHNGHWITLVVLDYRLNFRLWGLDTYLPYQVPVVAAHLASAALLRIVMLRVGVRGWLATGAALVFVFLGSGRDNITFGFQISMTGSLLAGLALLLIADHAGPVDRRDLVGLLVGVVGLMTSSVFVALLVGVGVAVLVRRGPRVAAFYAVPLGIVYGAWYLRYGAGEGDPLRLTGNTLRFVARMFGAVFSALTAGGVAGAVLVAVAAVGIVAAVQAGRRTGEWHAAALLVGLLAAWLVFVGLTALGRAESSVTADSHGASRYVHVGVALFLPAVAAGVERLMRWRTVAGVLAGLLLVVGVPRNLDRLADTDPLFGSGIDLFGADSEQIIEAMAHSRAIGEVSPDHVIATAEPRLQITAGWLARHAADGRIPTPADATPEIELTATSILVLDLAAPTASAPCTPIEPGDEVTLEAGDEIRFDGVVQVTVVDGDEAARPRPFTSADRSAVRALAGPVDVVVEGGATAVCRP